jgi:hypothetical protein
MEPPAVEVYHDWTIVQWLLVGALWAASIAVILSIDVIAVFMMDRLESRAGGIFTVVTIISLGLIGIVGTFVGPHLYFRHIDSHGVAIALGIAAFIGYGVIALLGWQRNDRVRLVGGGLGMAAVVLAGIADALERAAGSVPMTVTGLIVISAIVVGAIFASRK